MPFLITTAIYLLCAALCMPWGNFPLNDDWQYALVAKQFAETGSITVSVPVAPTLVGQTILTYPVIQLFGFSHLTLRLFTVFMSVICLWLFDRLLIRAKIKSELRTWALIALALNPIYFQLSLSFMTEIYGFFWVLLAAYFWFWQSPTSEKFATPDKNEFPLKNVAVVSAIFGGISFWTRQFSALLFPALWLSSFIIAYQSHRSFAAAFKRGILSAAVFTVVLFSYFPWAKITGNYKAEFALPLSSLFIPHPDHYFIHFPFWAIYLTCFCSGLLLLWKSPRVHRFTRSKMVCFAWLSIACLYAAYKFDYSLWPRLFRRPYFPFYGNIFTQSGLGPLTTSDVYVLNLPIHPTHLKWLWILIEIFLAVLTLRWISVWKTAANFFKSHTHLIEQRVLWFAILSIAITLFVVVGAFQGNIFDRYMLGAIVGVILTVTILFQYQGLRFTFLAYLPLICLALYSVAGTHDYFRWQEARERLISISKKMNIEAKQLDAGYETNGWAFYSERKDKNETDPCMTQNWFCINRTYRIAVNLSSKDEILATENIPSWLHNFPPMYLLRLR